MTDKEFLKTLGLKLKCQRIMAELSIKQVVEKTGLSDATILSMERGTTDFRILNLKRVITTYGVELKEVL